MGLVRMAVTLELSRVEAGSLLGNVEDAGWNTAASSCAELTDGSTNPTDPAAHS
jgi:hypothetical protein